MLKIQPRLVKKFLRKPKTVYDLIELSKKQIVDEQGDSFDFLAAEKISTLDTLEEALYLKNELEGYIYGE